MGGQSETSEGAERRLKTPWLREILDLPCQICFSISQISQTPEATSEMLSQKGQIQLVLPVELLIAWKVRSAKMYIFPSLAVKYYPLQNPCVY